jgi:hypothetical protein
MQAELLLRKEGETAYRAVAKEGVGCRQGRC